MKILFGGISMRRQGGDEQEGKLAGVTAARQ
jgi:hypothetical protein